MKKEFKTEQAVNESKHIDFYSKAKFYDIAFSFKNVSQENQTILDVFQKHAGCEALSFLDIAAGPASNAIEMALRGLRAVALDFSPEMVKYGLEKSKEHGVSLQYLKGDMKNFELQAKVDLATIFMDSTSYLLTNEDMVVHLQAVARNLNENGIYFLEMSHPRDVFSVGKSSVTEWTEKMNDIEVSVKWGSENDVFDPITQTTNVTATLNFKTPFEQGEIVDKSEVRCFTFNEIKALIACSGCFDLVDVLGSFSPNTPFSNDKTAWRMIPVLKRR